jgi:uncharacterized protein (TIGR01615 family)
LDFVTRGAGCHAPGDVIEAAAIHQRDVSTSAEGERAMQTLEKCVLQHVASGKENRQPDARLLAQHLAGAGFYGAAVLERSAHTVRLRGKLPMMPFKPFIVVTAYTSAEGSIVDLSAIIDLSFRARFEVHNASRTYAAVIAALPEHFVGSPIKLRAVASSMCALVKREFAAKGLSLPPWRTSTSVLSIWLPVGVDGRRHIKFGPGVCEATCDLV